MRTKCANCGMIYDIHISSMDMRTQMEIAQSGVCPGCKSNAHNPIPVRYSTSVEPVEDMEKK